MPSKPTRPSSSSRSSTPQAKAPWEPPPCSARFTILVLATVSGIAISRGDLSHDHAIGWAAMPAKPRADQIVDAQIVRLGAQGDGVAEHEGERLFVPYTVVGDRVRVRRIGADGAEPVEFLVLGPNRAAPPCPHFGPGRCGGCLLQHLADDVYAGWKTEML